MYRYQLIRVDSETLSRLGELKYRTHSRSFDDVIKQLLTNADDKKLR